MSSKRIIYSWILLFIIISTVGYWIVLQKLSINDVDYTKFNTSKKNRMSSNTDLVSSAPQKCKNLLTNMNKGKWIRKMDLSTNSTIRSKLLQEEKQMWKDLNTFWNKRGIQTGLWRSDGKCGYDIKQEQPPNSKIPHIGSWCNKDGPRPCCSNIHNGTCSTASEKNCKCEGCFDMRTVVLADLSEWVTEDSKCIWQYYSGDEVCDVIAASPYDDIIFIGESVTRNMYDALLNLLTEDYIYGSLRNNLTPEEHKLCIGPERFFWKECRSPPPNLSKLYKGLTVCKKYKQVPFDLSVAITMSPNTLPVIKGVKNRLGKEGSLVLFGLGIHISCDSQRLINEFLKPIIISIDEYYENRTQTGMKWPKIMIVATPAPGLLKPIKFLKGQGVENCKKYNMEVKNFCEETDIVYLDVWPFSLNAFSYDGTHHAFAVNAMKVQYFLNYIAENKHLHYLSMRTRQ